MSTEINSRVPDELLSTESFSKPVEHAIASHGVLRPKITVLGVGGAGGNAINNMIKSQLEGVDFIACNTDAQALEQSLTDKRVQLGLGITQGLGAGARPEVGRAAAEEALEEIARYVKGSNMVFITAGMGGGTGTGASPVIARLAREQGILTIGVVTKPFHFEGVFRMRTAEQGIEELQKHVDTLIVIPNQNLFRIANDKTTFEAAFKMADDVLNSGVRGVTDLIMLPGMINLDFADIRAVMSGMGKAMMGTGEAEGEDRAIKAAEAAISNPLLDDVSMDGALSALVSVIGGKDLTLWEADAAVSRILQEVDPNANIIFGSTIDDKMTGKIRVSVVAAGIQGYPMAHQPQPVKGFQAPQFGVPNLDLPRVGEETKVGGDSNLKVDPNESDITLNKDSREEGLPRAEEEIVASTPRKRVPTLFERISGVSRFGRGSSDSSEGKGSSKGNKESGSEDSTSADSNLDLPAFMRRR